MLLGEMHDEYISQVVRNLHKVGYEANFLFHFEKLSDNESFPKGWASSTPDKAAKLREYIESVVEERQDMSQDPAIQKVRETPTPNLTLPLTLTLTLALNAGPNPESNAKC